MASPLEIAGDRMCFGRKSVAPNRMENFVLPLRDNDRHYERSKQGAEADDPKENLLSFARIIVDEHAMDFHRDPGSAVILRRPQVHDLAVVCEDHVCERV